LQETLPLFDDPAPGLKIQLADRLRHLAADKLFVGTFLEVRRLAQSDLLPRALLHEGPLLSQAI
jgi:hypothetical protein